MSNSLGYSDNIQTVIKNTLLEGEVIKWSYLKQNKIIYAVTNKRAFIITISNKINIESFYHEDLNVINTVVDRNGSGDLLFKVTEYRDNSNELIKIENSGFFNINNVEEVESILLKEIKLIDEYDQKVNEGLYKNERITWSCNPIPRLFTFETVMKLICGLVMGSFTILFIFFAINIVLQDTEKQSSIPIFGGIMILAGVVFMAFAVKLLLSPISLWFKDKKTNYIITNKRVLIVKKGKTNKYLTILPGNIQDIHIIQKRANHFVLLKEMDHDFDKEYYHYGIGFYRISDTDGAIKWISPLLKNDSIINKD